MTSSRRPPAAGEPEPVTAAAVAGLAREVEALRRSVELLAGLPGRVEEVAGLVARLAETTAAAQQSARPAAGEPSWLDLPAGVNEAGRVLAGLVDWMAVVFLRYSDAARTSCRGEPARCATRSTCGMSG